MSRFVSIPLAGLSALSSRQFQTDIQNFPSIKSMSHFYPRPVTATRSYTSTRQNIIYENICTEAYSLLVKCLFKNLIYNNLLGIQENITILARNLNITIFANNMQWSNVRYSSQPAESGPNGSKGLIVSLCGNVCVRQCVSVSDSVCVSDSV